MYKRAVSAAALLLVLGACAGGPPPPPPPPPAADPTGTWDLMIEAQGMAIGGVLTISGSAADGYSGSVDTEMGGASIANIVVDGQMMTFSIPEASADVEVTFEGDEFTGGLNGAMGAASISGTKR